MPRSAVSVAVEVLLAALVLAVGFASGPSLLAGASPQTPDGPVTLPLDMAGAGGRPLIAVSIGGDEVAFILDSGAPTGLILESVATAAGSTTLEDTTINSPLGGPGLPARRVSVDDLVVGPLSLGPTELYAIADDAFPLPGGAAGVLPLARLARDHVVILDLAAGAVQLVGGAPAGIAWSPLDRTDGQMTVILQTGAIEIPAHIDTGNGGGLMLPLRYAQQLGLANEMRVVGSMRTIDAQREIHSAPYGEPVHLAGAELAVSDLLFADLPFGNIGGGALSGYALLLDRGAERFALARSGTRPSAATAEERSPAGAPQAGPAGPRLGLRAAPEPDAIRVVGTDSGSRAERAGLRAGDRVIAINGVAIREIPPTEVRQRLGATPLVLTVERDGEELRIEVPDA